MILTDRYTSMTAAEYAKYVRQQEEWTLKTIAANECGRFPEESVSACRAALDSK